MLQDNLTDLHMTCKRMDDIPDLKQAILERSLKVVQASNGDVEPCVICLDEITEGATTKPCGHHNFDYLCLLSWLERQNTCPLCKETICRIEYKDPAGKAAVYVVPAHQTDPTESSRSGHRRGASSFRNDRWRTNRHRRRQNTASNPVLVQRRDVYRHQLYSLHVGSNRVSAYQDLTPQRIAASAALTSRARAWIQRELDVFSFLGSDIDGVTTSASEPSLRNISNTFFLLEYILAIVKTVDLKGSSGHAQDMLADFLGREHARLFLHELSNFLRSPHETPEAWDRHVQYPKAVDQRNGFASSRAKRNRSLDLETEHGRHPHQELSERHPKRRFLDRYVPD